jgi:hypothetical protein
MHLPFLKFGRMQSETRRNTGRAESCNRTAGGAKKTTPIHDAVAIGLHVRERGYRHRITVSVETQAS